MERVDCCPNAWMKSVRKSTTCSAILTQKHSKLPFLRCPTTLLLFSRSKNRVNQTTYIRQVNRKLNNHTTHTGTSRQTFRIESSSGGAIWNTFLSKGVTQHNANSSGYLTTEDSNQGLSSNTKRSFSWNINRGTEIIRLIIIEPLARVHADHICTSIIGVSHVTALEQFRLLIVNLG